MNITITKSDDATPRVAALQRTVHDGSLEKVMGQAVTNRVKQHLGQLSTERHHQGAPANFYADAVRSTTFTSQPGSVVITIAKLGFAQRFYGGLIVPTRGKYLTIPAAPEAYGRRAREFSNLRFGFTEGPFGGLVPALVKASASIIKVKNRGVKRLGSVGGEVMFYLARKVFQRADPSVLPSETELKQVAVAAAEKRLERLGARGGSNA